MLLRRTTPLIIFLLGSTLASDASAQSITADLAIDLPLRDGAKQRLLWATPRDPRGAIVMLPGGTGNVGIESNRDLKGSHNFVVRTRAAWNARGYAVLIPDTITNEGLRGVRSSRGYAQVIEVLVRFAHEQAHTPVFLLGTSQGSIAAMNGAAHAAHGSINGVILTESVSVLGGSGETVFDAEPAMVRAPALVVANRNDRCNVAPPANASKIAAAMTASPDVRVLFVSGGVDRDGNECGSLSPHGYYGIEAKVVADIANWMDAHLAPGDTAR